MSDFYNDVRKMAVEIALEEVGKKVVEDTGPNRGTHIDKYLKRAFAPLDQGLNWCGMFVNYVFKEAANRCGKTVPWGNTTFWKGSSVINWAYANFDTVVMEFPLLPGDIYVMNKGHIGMVRRTTEEGSDLMFTIDGNQSTFDAGGKSLKARERNFADMDTIIRI
ncbi:MAG: hypothetical protein H7070_08105 [Saprospiraceae bacterium]|nr:hypothetical protein [Pyrinomonadaceae bacterium]